jgi:hypothetical protein
MAAMVVTRDLISIFCQEADTSKMEIQDFEGSGTGIKGSEHHATKLRWRECKGIDW